MIIGVVGACAAGKSTLIAALKQAGYEARHIAQEHSYVGNMWQRLTNPDVLIYLQVSYPMTIQRRQLDWTLEEYQEQLRRLQHARQHADLVIDTDPLSPQQIYENVIAYLRTNAS
jgi:RNase adaptor protein for sRNA GlmZ degradation